MAKKFGLTDGELSTIKGTWRLVMDRTLAETAHQFNIKYVAHEIDKIPNELRSRIHINENCMKVVGERPTGAQRFSVLSRQVGG